MDFKKDILLVDLETTGLDASKHEIIQLAAILLDRKTLKEKKVFNVYVKPQKWKTRSKEAMAVNGIVWEQLSDAPTLKEALTMFAKAFDPASVLLSHYGGPVDTDFLRAAYKTLKKPFPFDHHYFNVWGVFFAYLAKKNMLTNTKRFAGFTLDDIMKKFKVTADGRHDGLVDCRVEAEILRRVMKDL